MPASMTASSVFPALFVTSLAFPASKLRQNQSAPAAFEEEEEAKERTEAEQWWSESYRLESYGLTTLHYGPK